ncbi:tryptophan 2,3-dioxygenase family protein [Mangrovivirga sp. M17]|uniref:Tryptophan 2,3-dioxygenase family protein n=1 Tax=Mangrovivirga halotolerans TaxID=2993936 RepID=A0ABT3RN57_9BACT|nr:tryptophan 2,3-dioxygenase family protein [Mangrovivirga halotolerans]MCX2742600.1 tryptophan 2,3-dioxygenase family protein [Mangrovivirga halotolerans]
MKDEILKRLQKKYDDINQPADAYLEGLYHAKPINYWDYIQVDTLLTLQKTRTDFHDEKIFIVYHQVTELVLNLIIHELEKLTSGEIPEEEELDIRMNRCVNYADMLINSFSVMSKGMSYEEYNQFRMTLTPASGFQSVQFRLVEFYCTDIENLMKPEDKKKLNGGESISDKFEYLYWQRAGKNPKTGEKSLTLQNFEDKYKGEMVSLAEKMRENNLNKRLKTIEKEKGLSPKLLETVKAFEKKFNYDWPMVHLETARFYLTGSPKKEATGGSDWEKYLHPDYQQRRYFPEFTIEK